MFKTRNISEIVENIEIAYNTEFAKNVEKANHFEKQKKIYVICNIEKY